MSAGVDVNGAGALAADALEPDGGRLGDGGVTRRDVGRSTDEMLAA